MTQNMTQKDAKKPPIRNLWINLPKEHGANLVDAHFSFFPEVKKENFVNISRLLPPNKKSNLAQENVGLTLLRTKETDTAAASFFLHADELYAVELLLLILVFSRSRNPKSRELRNATFVSPPPCNSAPPIHCGDIYTFSTFFSPQIAAYRNE